MDLSLDVLPELNLSWVAKGGIQVQMKVCGRSKVTDGLCQALPASKGEPGFSWFLRVTQPRCVYPILLLCLLCQILRVSPNTLGLS